MLHSSVEKIERLVGYGEVLEALYLGMIELMLNPNSELHLYVGICCCATIRSIAEIERELPHIKIDEGQQVVTNILGMIVGRDTLLVNEGLHHLLQAKRLKPEIEIPEKFKKVTSEIIQDLQDYLQQDFQNISCSQLDYSLQMAAVAAIVLICQLQGDEPEQVTQLPTSLIEDANKLILELSASGNKQAAFYTALS
ncbi:MAG TPA: hypothetical protein VK184_02840 [Nostocaceae cyanobacterium]|nr:hypothetical protein [Nostocaceae cyanobacterium]